MGGLSLYQPSLITPNWELEFICENTVALKKFVAVFPCQFGHLGGGISPVLQNCIENRIADFIPELWSYSSVEKFFAGRNQIGCGFSKNDFIYFLFERIS
jgi:hypothetical protein